MASNETKALEEHNRTHDEEHVPGVVHYEPLANTNKSKWQRRTAIFACGAGLFTDGYLNGIIGSVNSVLAQLYPIAYAQSPAQGNITSIAFAGEVVGIIIFGYTSDHWSRKWSLVISTIICFVFAALGAGAYGAGGSISGLLAALAAYRFILGIGIGGEYPAGSVASAENTGELPEGTRNRWFVWFSNVAIDLAFVVASIVATIVIYACGTNLAVAWRVMLGIGVIPPLSLIWMRFKLDEPEAFKRGTMAKTKTPWKLIFKLYGGRLFIVSAIWFIYDFSAYAFGIYFSTVTTGVLGPHKASSLLYANAWYIFMNFLYMPGAILGSWVTDWIGPRKALTFGVFAQAIVGFIMAGVYKYLAMPQNIAGFVVVYGIFLSLGELGPGDNIGLICAKTSATGIRGQYYAFAAAWGKIGAFVGTWVFPYLSKAGHTSTQSAQYPFWLASGMAVISAALAWFGLPEIRQDILDTEEVRFREYLEIHGYDTSKLGLEGYSSSGSSNSVGSYHVGPVEKE